MFPCTVASKYADQSVMSGVDRFPLFFWQLRQPLFVVLGSLASMFKTSA
jgi:hypothetical protein